MAVRNLVTEVTKQLLTDLRYSFPSTPAPYKTTAYAGEGPRISCPPYRRRALHCGMWKQKVTESLLEMQTSNFLPVNFLESFRKAIDNRVPVVPVLWLVNVNGKEAFTEEAFDSFPRAREF